jgi:hypothetical protein
MLRSRTSKKCPRACKRSFEPSQRVEENQKQFFNTFVLYNPGIKVIEAVGVDKKKKIVIVRGQ